VGVSNTVLTLLVYILLLKVLGVWYLAASAIGFALGATNGFLWNRRWTFREHVSDSLTPVRWGIVQTCGLAINEVLPFLLVQSGRRERGVRRVCVRSLAVCLDRLPWDAASQLHRWQVLLT